MEKQRIFTALAASFAVFLIWSVVAQRIWPPQKPDLQEQRSAPAGVSGPDATDQAQPVAPATGHADSSETATTQSQRKPVAVGADAIETGHIGGTEGLHESPYRMELFFDSLGGCIASAQLSDYSAEVDTEDRYVTFQPVKIGVDQFMSLATEKIVLDRQGSEVILDQVPWQVTEETSADGCQTVVFSVDVAEQGQPILRLRKTFQLAEQAEKDLRHDVKFSLEVQNLSQAGQTCTLTQRGPIGFAQEDVRADDHRIYAAHRIESGVSIDKVLRTKVLKAGPVNLIGQGGGAEFLWVALCNKYFTFTMAPVAASTSQGIELAAVQPICYSSDKELHSDLAFRLVTAPIELEPNQTKRIDFNCYLGPKSKKIFDGVPEYAALDYYSQVTADFAWCTFSSLTVLMIWLLDGLYAVVRNYGIAIIILVLVVRTILHPITKKGQVNMVKMQSQMGRLQPKIEELKKRCANDKQKLNQEMMKIYSAEGVSPASQMLTCLPMVLQMPIWIALWTSLNNNIAMRHAPFFLWIKDLTQPDHLITFEQGFSFPLMGQITAFNLLPILLAVSMFLQQKFMPKPQAAKGGKQPDQMAQQQKMMYFMTVFFGLIFYNAPSGLTLYIMASNIFAVIEQWRIRKHIKEQEESEKGLAPSALPDKPDKPDNPPDLEPATAREAPHRKPSLLQKLQKAAEEAKQVRRKN